MKLAYHETRRPRELQSRHLESSSFQSSRPTKSHTSAFAVAKAVGFTPTVVRNGGAAHSSAENFGGSSAKRLSDSSSTSTPSLASPYSFRSTTTTGGQARETVGGRLGAMRGSNGYGGGSSSGMSASYHQDYGGRLTAGTGFTSTSGLRQEKRYSSMERLSGYRVSNNNTTTTINNKNNNGGGAPSAMSTSLYDGAGAGGSVRNYSISAISQAQPPRRSTSFASGLTLADSTSAATTSGYSSGYHHSSTRDSTAVAASPAVSSSTSGGLSRYQYRSRTPQTFRNWGAESATSTTAATATTSTVVSSAAASTSGGRRYDRDYRSVSRFDDYTSSKYAGLSTSVTGAFTLSRRDDSVEKTYEKLFKRYIVDDGKFETEKESVAPLSPLSETSAQRGAERSVTMMANASSSSVNDAKKREDSAVAERKVSSAEQDDDESEEAELSCDEVGSSDDNRKNDSKEKEIVPVEVEEPKIPSGSDKTVSSPSHAPTAVPETTKLSEVKAQDAPPAPPMMEAKIEPRALKPATSQLDKLIRMVDFDQRNFQLSVMRVEEQMKERSPLDNAQSPADGDSYSTEQKCSFATPSPVTRTTATRLPDAAARPGSPTSPTRAVTRRSRSKSPATNLIEQATARSGTNSLTQPASRRTTRTINNLVGELEAATLFQRQKTSQQNEQPTEKKTNEKMPPPLLLVTQASQPEDDDDDGGVSANVMLPSLSGGQPCQGGGDGSDSASDDDGEDDDYDDEEEYSDEEYTDEDEEEFESDWEYDTSVRKTLQLLPSAGCSPKGDLYPVDRHRSTFSNRVDDGSEFELPFVVASAEETSRNASRGRVSQSNALPPPVFTASVSYDGMDSTTSSPWDSAVSDIDEDVHFYSSLGDAAKSPQAHYSSGDEAQDVDVGCTLTLVEKAALRGSDDDESSSIDEYYHSSEYEDDESYNEDEAEYYEEEEEEEEPMSGGEEPEEKESSGAEASSMESVGSGKTQVEDASLTLNLPTAAKEAESPASTAKAELPLSGTAPEPRELQVVAAKVASLDEDEAECGEELWAGDGPPVVEVADELELAEDMDSSERCAERVTTYARPLTERVEDEQTGSIGQAIRPRTDFARKAVIQPMKSEKLSVVTPRLVEPRAPKPSVGAVGPPGGLTPTTPDVGVEVAGKPPTTLSRDPSLPKRDASNLSTTAKSGSFAPTPVVEPPDKSALRKSTLNMTADEKLKADQQQREQARQRARRTGAVSSMMERFKEPEVKPEPIVYKRSTRLQPTAGDEEAVSRPKRTFAPIVKPVLNDDFERQMAELREQMRTKESKLRSEYRTISQGIHSKTDEAKLRAMEDKHKERIGSALTTFSMAESEAKRWKEQHESDVQRRHREAEARAAAAEAAAEEERKRRAALQRPPEERKKTVRRVRKADLPSAVADPTRQDVTDAGSTTTLPPQGSASRKLSNAGVEQQPPSRRTSIKESQKVAVAAAAAPSPTVIVAEQPGNGGGGVARRRQPSLVVSASSPTSDDASRAAAGADHKRLSQERRSYGSARKKTEELMNFVVRVDDDAVDAVEAKENAVQRARPSLKRRPRRRRKRRPFTRTTTDIDELLGWTTCGRTFEALDAFFASVSAPKRKGDSAWAADNGEASSAKRMRAVGYRRVWISELRDIDRLYKASELRDIRLSAEEEEEP